MVDQIKINSLDCSITKRQRKRQEEVSDQQTCGASSQTADTQTEIENHLFRI